MVAGFWTSLLTNCPNCGEITYRAVNDTALLATISDDVRGVFPAAQLAAGFGATSAVIATWNNVARYSSTQDGAEALQIVIAFNTDTIFIFLLYANDKPQTFGNYGTLRLPP
eukprot:jgi/Chlat1/1520/Chrsp120S01797